MHKESVPELIRDLEQRDQNIRKLAIYLLGAHGATSADAVLALIRALKDRNAEMRSRAAEALGHTALATQAVPALGQALFDKEPYVRYAAINALKKIGPSAVPVLNQALKNDDGQVRAMAAEILGDLGPVASETTPTLIKALEDKEAVVRASAAAALGKLGSVEDQVIPVLINALGDSEDAVRSSAADALVTIGPPIIPVLIQTLKEGHWHAVQVLGRIGPPAVPALSQLLQEGATIDLKLSAIEALSTIGGSSAISALHEALEDHHGHVGGQAGVVRSSAAIALAHIGSASVPALAHVLLLASDSEDTHVLAAQALGMIGAEARDAVPTLTQTLRGASDPVKWYSIEALANIGPAAHDAVPDLIQVLHGGNYGLRARAAHALEKIGTPDALEALGVYRRKKR
ncbi:MAG: HEAT repeat domain-containing protein [Candidatus Omnitrophica bacterium]|nr:HEAT repeat domain-containing protein [Candidatus Omnitrophota bacterium]